VGEGYTIHEADREGQLENDLEKRGRDFVVDERWMFVVRKMEFFCGRQEDGILLFMWRCSCPQEFPYK
jgi:hypothetical protein